MILAAMIIYGSALAALLVWHRRSRLPRLARPTRRISPTPIAANDNSPPQGPVIGLPYAFGGTGGQQPTPDRPDSAA